MHLLQIPQCTIQNRNVHISVLNGALWDVWQVRCGIYEFDVFHRINSLQPSDLYNEFEYYAKWLPLLPGVRELTAFLYSTQEKFVWYQKVLTLCLMNSLKEDVFI